MTIFAIIENNVIENVAVADDKITMELLLPGKVVIEETEVTGVAWIGSEVIDGKFKPPQPTESWTWDADAFDWIPPVPRPEFPSYWDEESLSWIEIQFTTTEEENA